MSKTETLHRSKPITRFKKPAHTDEVSKMTPEQTARYLAFADPSNSKVKAMLAATLMKDRKLRGEQEKQTEENNLIGILKAAEARNRLRNARLQHQNLRAQEINFLVSFQRNAKGAVRLEVFLPPRRNMVKLSDCMNTVQRGRIEEILEDETGEIFIRRP
ncbi:protein LKAAEAR1 [Anolis carolinensis]|uniref:LKAAEAR motif containing 1 n=1 Tax=Anolis carolinensis TaxID=28377 RepID=A0A803TE45_ANOCA|nr:PREDICTED: protein LKAAEAR1 [Anolis carolinensis]XP_008108417.1 PREDICTED: protein LKAAEAR1 [Anolis carolinensis]XP_008108418.1 PREDICTED: protein LKAAEAR1 [Anolis carolinensis]|eukprot:XP_003220764.1 PREDICTED: protein LKAAEAR1 [Anolis carolinensis]